MVIENIRPEDLSKRRLQIVDRELEKRGITLDEQWAYIIKECIDATGDFDFAENLYFSKSAVEEITRGLASGCHIITDSKMSQTGIIKELADAHGNRVMCFVNAEDVIEEGRRRGCTPGYISMEKALLLERPILFLVGEDPEAIRSILRLKEEEGLNPVAVIGTPAGFLNVEESKKMLMASPIPCIVTRGSKGGSHVAAAIVNAIQGKM